MALYQPTNITPDLISGVENGVVFSNPGGYVDVSWAVNGNSPMTAYQIEFFQNNAASTPGTDTGKIVLAEPFCAKGAEGNEQRFSVSLPFGVGGTYFTIASLSTNRQGKIRITQWWGDGTGQNVVQRSLSVFRICPHGSVSVTGPTLVNGRRAFSASVTLPSAVIYGEIAVEWCRWQIFEVDPLVPDSDVLIQDTGKVWGATNYDWTAAPLTPGTYYAKFSCYTSVGETLTAQTADFSVLENAVDVTGGITASCDSGKSAVLVEFGEIAEVPGKVTGERITQEGGLAFDLGGGAIWKLPQFSTGSWGFVWTGYMEQFGYEVFRLVQSGGAAAGFGFTTDQTFDSAVLAPYVNLRFPRGFDRSNMVLIAFVWTGSGTAAWCAGAWENGDYAPSEWGSVNFTQTVPTALHLLYGAETREFRLCFGSNGIDAIRYFADYGEWQGADNAEFPSFTLDAGAAALFQTFPVANGDLWRSSASGGPLRYIGSAGDGRRTAIYDYSAANLKSPDAYTYCIIQDDGEGGGSIMRSNSVSPCLWDWVLIEASGGPRSVQKRYTVIRAFKFALNVSTGSNGNGNSPNVQSTFTPYPVVMRDTQNRQSGVLTGLIGSTVAPGKYADSNQLRDAIRALSVSKNKLFIRSRRGDFLRVAISGEIATTINDGSLEQEVTVSIPWVEIGPADGAVVEQEGTK